MFSNLRDQKGLTLFELTITITIIAILMLIVILAIDPGRQFREARNDKRWSQVYAISTGIYEYIIKQDKFPAGVDNIERQLGTANSGCNKGCGESETCLDLSQTLKPYLLDIPKDPYFGSDERTLYTIVKNEDNVITIRACRAENNIEIKISR